jgi:hypothetical protein
MQANEITARGNTSPISFFTLTLLIQAFVFFTGAGGRCARKEIAWHATMAFRRSDARFFMD